MKKVKGLVLGSALALLVTGGVVQAGEKWVGYNTDVGPFNGSGYTSYSEMTGYLMFSETISVINDSVESDYVVDIRGQRNGGNYRNTDWVRNVGDKQSFEISRKILAEAGDKYRLQISNDLTTPTTVTVKGSFKTW